MHNALQLRRGGFTIPAVLPNGTARRQRAQHPTATPDKSITVLETKPIKQQIKTLQERSDALRGYL